MDERRIKQAERNFITYLKEGKIKKVKEFNSLVYRTYLRNSLESLNSANQLAKSKTSSLWVVVTSYYSMFYSACAYLYKLGYKPGDEIVHQVVNESLIVQTRHKIKNHLLENYSEEKDKALVMVDNYLLNYERERGKRASFAGLNCYADLYTGVVTCENPEELGLILETLDANSFNYVLADVSSGIWKIEIQAHAESSIALGGSGLGSSKAEAFVGLGSTRIEVLRLVKGTQLDPIQAIELE